MRIKLALGTRNKVNRYSKDDVMLKLIISSESLRSCHYSFYEEFLRFECALSSYHVMDPDW